MFPTIVAIGYKHIVKDHHSQPDHDEFSHITNVKRRVITVGLEAFPAGPIFIAERGDVLSKNVTQKSQFEAFMKRIRRNNYFFVVLE